MDAAQAQHWLYLLLEGLQYLHSKGIFHRDIKPANILFDEQELPVLVDFGSSVQPQGQEVTTGAFSPAYAAPEQILNPASVGPWTDLYSLAATWHELLTGQRPPALEADGETRALAPWPPCPAALQQSILRNLAPQPSGRCQNCDQWLAWLQQGKAPQGKKRRWPYAAAAVPTAFLLAWMLLPRAGKSPDQPPRTEQAAEASDLQAIRAGLLQREREHIQWDAWIQEMEAFNRKLESQVAFWKKEARQWGDAALAHLQNSPPGPPARQAWKDEQQKLEELQARFYQDIRALHQERQTLLERNPLKNKNELNQFPVRTPEEAAWKSSVDEELYQEAQQWETRASHLWTGFDDFHRTTGQYFPLCQEEAYKLPPQAPEDAPAPASPSLPTP